jgi:hypothetical protein
MTKQTDLRKKFKIGDLVANKYAWKGEPTKIYVFKVTKFPHAHFKPPAYDILYAKLYKVKEGRNPWVTHKGAKGDHFNWGEKAFWDFDFTIGSVNPTNGTGKAYKFRG